jgi:hypothetical protein
VSSERIVGVMGWRASVVQLYSLALLKVKHWQKPMVEWLEQGAHETREDPS